MISDYNLNNESINHGDLAKIIASGTYLKESIPILKPVVLNCINKSK